LRQSPQLDQSSPFFSALALTALAATAAVSFACSSSLMLSIFIAVLFSISPLVSSASTDKSTPSRANCSANDPSPAVPSSALTFSDSAAPEIALDSNAIQPQGEGWSKQQLQG